MRSSSPTTMPFHQLLVDLVLGHGQLVGDGALLAGHRRARREVVEGGAVVEEVDHPPERGLGPHRELHRGHPGPEGGPHLGQGPVEVGPLSVELVHHHHPGEPEGGGRPPGVLGLGLDAVGGAHHHHGQVGDAQRGVQVGGEVGVAGGVEEVDLAVLDGEGGDGQLHRELPRRLLGLEVADGRALVDRALAGDGPGGGQQGLGQGRLAGPVVADEDHVADVGGR